jgi:hypothetical protein
MNFGRAHATITYFNNYLFLLKSSFQSIPDVSIILDVRDVISIVGGRFS